MSDHNALLHRIVRDLAHASPDLIDNALACIVDAQNLVRSAGYMVDRTVIDAQLRDARRRLDHAGLYLWGSYPPQGVRVDDNWHYTVTQ